jgi:hypothetical protein
MKNKLISLQEARNKLKEYSEDPEYCISEINRLINEACEQNRDSITVDSDIIHPIKNELKAEGFGVLCNDQGNYLICWNEGCEKW